MYSEGREGDVPLEQINEDEGQTQPWEHLKSSVAPEQSQSSH